MSWTHWFTRNWANLSPEATDPTLRPIETALAPGEAVTKGVAAIERAPRWRVVDANPGAGTLHATHTTILWRFVDDIHLKFEPHGSGTRIVGESRSRIGKGDLGQNARNLRELKQVLSAIGG